MFDVNLTNNLSAKYYFRGWGFGSGVRSQGPTKILAKNDFLGSMKDAGIFLGHEKKEGFLWVAKKGLRYSFGCAKKVMFFG